MHILTITTKRFLQETVKEQKYRKFYSSISYTPGDVIEVISGGKKTPIIILKSESASEYKQQIRMGSLTVEKLVLSKTGEYAGGVVIGHYPIAVIKTYLADYNLAHQQKDAVLQQIFPKKRQSKTSKQSVAVTGKTLGTLSVEQYRSKKPTHHTELQLFVDEVRIYFNEQAKFGQGSFSYYLGFCKKIPLHNLWQIFAETKQSRKNNFGQKKLFWWKIGQFIKEQKKP